MKGELLRQIRQAEEEAARREAESRSEAEKILKDARRRAQEMIEEGKAQADEEAAAAVESLRTELRASEAQTVKVGQDEAEQLRRRFQDRQEGVAERIIELWEERYA